MTKGWTQHFLLAVNEEEFYGDAHTSFSTFFSSCLSSSNNKELFLRIWPTLFQKSFDAKYFFSISDSQEDVSVTLQWG